MEAAIAALLSNILDELPTPELVKCRRVSQTWEKESTRLLRKRLDLKISFGYPMVFPMFSGFGRPPPVYTREFDSASKPPDLYHRCPSQQQPVPPPRRRTTMTLSDFTNFLLENKSTPENPSFLVSHVNLECGIQGIYELPEVAQFLQNYGEQIKTLGLSHYTNYYCFISSLLKFTPNLETLIVRSCEWPKSFCGVAKQRRIHLSSIWASEQGFPVLPHLKLVWVQIQVEEDLSRRRFLSARRINSADKALLNLLTTAPAVQSVKFTGATFPLELTSDLSSLGKLHLLQIEGINLELFHLVENNLEDLLHLEELTGTKSGPGPKVGIETMDIFTRFTTLQSFLSGNQVDHQLTHNWRRIFVCLVKFLENNRKTLTGLSIGNAACYLWKNSKTVGFIPKLENVQKLRFQWTDTEFMEFQRQHVHNNMNNPPENSYNYDYIIPELYENFPVLDPDSNSLSSMFPGLKTLIISWNLAHVNWFPFWDEIFPTVKNLKLTIPFSPEAEIHLVTPKLPDMFPALVFLNVGIYVEGFARNFGELLRFRTLEELTLVIISDRTKDAGEQRSGQLATMATILGVDVQILREIHRQWEESGNCEISQDLSINPSIFTLTGLKKLGLNLSFFDERMCAFFVGCIGQLGVNKKADFPVCITLSHCGHLGMLNANAEPIREFETLFNRFPKVEVAILKHQ